MRGAGHTGSKPALRDPRFSCYGRAIGRLHDLKASLNLKIDHPETNNPINVGYIHKNGTLWTKSLVGGVSTDIAMRYNQTLSNLIGGDMLGWGRGLCRVWSSSSC